LVSLELSFDVDRSLANITGLVCFESDGKIIYANDAWYKILGIKKTDNPESWPDNIYKEDLPKVNTTFQNILKMQVGMELEFRIGNDTKGGRSYQTWARSSTDANMDPDGKLLGYFGTLVDITSIKLAEEYQRQLTIEAVENKRQMNNYIVS